MGESGWPELYPIRLRRGLRPKYASIVREPHDSLHMIPFSGGSTTHMGILPASPADSPVVVTGSVLRKYPAPLILLPIEQVFAQLVPLQKMEDGGS